MDMLFFDSIDKLGRIVLTTVMVYILVVITTKVSGKRSTSQLNNFDWIVTVMIGSLGASTILLKEIPLIEGFSSILVLYVLQFLVTKYAAISPQFSNVILSEPRIVFYQGQYLPEAMRTERLTRQELECAMRSEGVRSLDDVEAIVFESDAKLTVITKDSNNQDTDSISETLSPLTD
ncbi:YetF domain-containing protein [Psychrobacter sp. FBL11]|uniref:YetF domain-containing protein n=1 Tax=Psychrobacter saeujeotis TaxID=3143436 RepID=A0ABU9XAC5_9GAMM|nr:YetF domain-containing protein [uncultured Psychrobacter sp.]